MNRGRICLFVFLILGGFKVFSQISSPYSSSGIGEISFQGLPQNFAMGEVGIGMPSAWHINIENPALLTYNSLSSFQVGLQGDFRKSSTSTASNREASLGLRYMAMSFPVISRSRWITSFAMLPLSSVSYHTVSNEVIDDIYRVQTDYFGDGGISQIIWANGFRVTKSLSLGFKASYVFGSINDEANIKMVLDSVNAVSAADYIIVYKQNTSYSDVKLSFGASYALKLSERKFLNFGATYNLSSQLRGKRDTSFERQGFFGSVFQEQLLSSDEAVSFDLPMGIGLGVSYEKLGNYKIGLDVRSQRWEGSSSDEPGEIFRNTTSISLGAEITPNYQSVKSYLARARYRAGFSYRESPYILNGEKINDFGINFGTSLPMANASSLDLGFKFGVRGTTQNSLIRENYLQIVLGATINDRWFKPVLYN